MREKIALIAGGIAGAGILASAVFIGSGILTTAAATASREAPPTTIVQSSGSRGEESPSTVTSNLPAELIAGLPEYAATHDRETYIRVQTWIKICMGDTAGYSYSFDPAASPGVVPGFVSTGFIPAPPEFDQHEQIALYGEPGNLLPEYDWMKGGCYGDALHKAGLLDDGPTFTDSELAQIAETYHSIAFPSADASGARNAPDYSVSPAVLETVSSSITACMAEQGIAYSFDPVRNDDGTVSLRNGSFTWEPASGERTESFDREAALALDGPPKTPGAPYDWAEGGCYGQAIHEAGLSGTE